MALEPGEARGALNRRLPPRSRPTRALKALEGAAKSQPNVARSLKELATLAPEALKAWGVKSLGSERPSACWGLRPSACLTRAKLVWAPTALKARMGTASYECSSGDCRGALKARRRRVAERPPAID